MYRCSCLNLLTPILAEGNSGGSFNLLPWHIHCHCPGAPSTSPEPQDPEAVSTLGSRTPSWAPAVSPLCREAIRTPQPSSKVIPHRQLRWSSTQHSSSCASFILSSHLSPSNATPYFTDLSVCLLKCILHEGRGLVSCLLLYFSSHYKRLIHNKDSVKYLKNRWIHLRLINQKNALWENQIRHPRHRKCSKEKGEQNSAYVTFALEH